MPAFELLCDRVAKVPEVGIGADLDAPYFLIGIEYAQVETHHVPLRSMRTTPGSSSISDLREDAGWKASGTRMTRAFRSFCAR